MHEYLLSVAFIDHLVIIIGITLVTAIIADTVIKHKQK